MKNPKLGNITDYFGVRTLQNIRCWSKKKDIFVFSGLKIQRIGIVGIPAQNSFL